MKLFSITFLFTVLFVSGYSQTKVPRVPLYEVFSSSTCPPCRPANEHLVPVFESREGKISVVKYQMSWPGTGDPYYTSEANSRRNVYGVNSIPYFFRNAISQDYSRFDSASIDQDLLDSTGMSMGLRYMINPDSQSISIRARAEALEAFTVGAQRIYIAIVEKVTYQNKKSNGESEFHHVFKKMLPEGGGELIAGNLEPGYVFEFDSTYVFQGSYRLPNNSGDPTNSAIEHSIENFDSLHVIMFMQGLSSPKLIYQSANGLKSKDEDDFLRDWGSWPSGIESKVNSHSLQIFPNPANSLVNIQSSIEAISGVEIFDIAGKMVLRRIGNDKNIIQLNSSLLGSGTYFVRISMGQKAEIKKLVLVK
jgi:hypothetical protein